MDLSLLNMQSYKQFQPNLQLILKWISVLLEIALLRPFRVDLFGRGVCALAIGLGQLGEA